MEGTVEIARAITITYQTHRPTWESGLGSGPLFSKRVHRIDARASPAQPATIIARPISIRTRFCALRPSPLARRLAILAPRHPGRDKREDNPTTEDGGSSSCGNTGRVLETRTHGASTWARLESTVHRYRTLRSDQPVIKTVGVRYEYRVKDRVLMTGDSCKQVVSPQQSVRAVYRTRTTEQRVRAVDIMSLQEQGESESSSLIGGGGLSRRKSGSARRGTVTGAEISKRESLAAFTRDLRPAIWTPTPAGSPPRRPSLADWAACMSDGTSARWRA